MGGMLKAVARRQSPYSSGVVETHQGRRCTVRMTMQYSRLVAWLRDEHLVTVVLRASEQANVAGESGMPSFAIGLTSCFLR